MPMRPILPLALLALAGCTTTPRIVPTAAPARPVAAPPTPAPLAADWRDWPVTAGTWRYAPDERGSVAMFGQAGGDAIAVLRCDRSGGRVFLSVAGAVAGTLTVRTSSTTRALPAGATGGTPAYVAATLTAADPVLDAIAFSRGRYVLSLAGARPLVLPAWAEVGRVIEDCRP